MCRGKQGVASWSQKQRCMVGNAHSNSGVRRLFAASTYKGRCARMHVVVGWELESRKFRVLHMCSGAGVAASNDMEACHVCKHKRWPARG